MWVFLSLNLSFLQNEQLMVFYFQFLLLLHSNSFCYQITNIMYFISNIYNFIIKISFGSVWCLILNLCILCTNPFQANVPFLYPLNIGLKSVKVSFGN